MSVSWPPALTDSVTDAFADDAAPSTSAILLEVATPFATAPAVATFRLHGLTVMVFPTANLLPAGNVEAEIAKMQEPNVTLAVKVPTAPPVGDVIVAEVVSAEPDPANAMARFWFATDASSVPAPPGNEKEVPTIASVTVGFMVSVVLPATTITGEVVDLVHAAQVTAVASTDAAMIRREMRGRKDDWPDK